MSIAREGALQREYFVHKAPTNSWLCEMMTCGDGSSTRKHDNALPTYHCAGPVANSYGKSAKRFAVQEVTRLIEDANLCAKFNDPANQPSSHPYLWVVPQTCRNNKFDLLACGTV